MFKKYKEKRNNTVALKQLIEQNVDKITYERHDEPHTRTKDGLICGKQMKTYIIPDKLKLICTTTGFFSMRLDPFFGQLLQYNWDIKISRSCGWDSIQLPIIKGSERKLFLFTRNLINQKENNEILDGQKSVLFGKPESTR